MAVVVVVVLAVVVVIAARGVMVAIPEAGSFLFFAFLDFVLLVNFCFSEI